VSTVRRRLLISGIVQGVGFRFRCRRMAAEAGVSGWCRNLADGRVEACFEGPEEAVARAVAWCRQGPAGAVVTGVEEFTEPVEGERGFWLA
jgi:acylphosphatase